MGTSQSSPGAPSNRPMIPPWVPDLPVDDEEQDDQAPPTPVPVAPRARFMSARRSLGKYSRSGLKTDMQRGVGHYVRKGLGGSSTTVRRLGGTVRTAGALYGALSSVAAGKSPSPGSPLDPTLLSGRSANEVIDAVIEAVEPVDGTLDTESSRTAIKSALAELLNRDEDADILNLSGDQRLFVIEQYLGFNFYNRLYLDVGKAIQDKAPDPITALSRLKDIRDYVRETVSAAFRQIKRTGEAITARWISWKARAVLKGALEVFEEYT